MSKPKKTSQQIFERVAKGADRSPAFWWLHEHYVEMLAASAVERTDWAALAADIYAHGITDAHGKPVMPETLRKTWYRVRKYMATHQVQRTIPKPAFPSRASSSWSPPAATKPIVPIAPKTTAFHPAMSDQPRETAAWDPTGDEQIERVRAELRERSNRRNGIF